MLRRCGATSTSLIAVGFVLAAACTKAPLTPTNVPTANVGIAAGDAPLPADVVERAATPFTVQGTSGALSEPELFSLLESARAVCLGEEHDSAAHHYVQRQVLLELAERAKRSGRQLAVGFEMFQRPFQSALSEFVAGKSEESVFLHDVEYKARWGFDFALYRPLLAVAKQYQLPALALNARRELTRAIGRGGIAALTAEQRTEVPELDLTSGEHRQFFNDAMGAHPTTGDTSLDNIYAAQVTWDETMAESSARWLTQAGESGQLAILAGAGHCHRSAIPARLARRASGPVVSVRIVGSAELKDVPPALYDVRIVLPARPPAGAAASRQH
jgi:uncharacterized iron-regulated protein